MEVLRNTELRELSSVELVQKIAQREIMEKSAVASTTTEILQKLGTPLRSLPQKSKNLLKQAAEYQLAMEVASLDPIAFSLQHTDSALKEMDDEYEILKLSQKNAALDRRIKKNQEELEQWRRELEIARKDLKSQNPNPETICDEIHIARQKVASYEQSYEKTKSKFAGLRVPTELYPASIEALISRLETLKAEESDLKDKADHITLARSAKQKLLQLKASKF